MKRLIHGPYRRISLILLAKVWLLSGCLDSAESNSEGAEQIVQPGPNTAPEYTADLSIFGPHPGESEIIGPFSSAWMALTEAEREKTMHCSGAKHAQQVSGLISGIRHAYEFSGFPSFDAAAKEYLESRLEEILSSDAELNNGSWPRFFFYGESFAKVIPIHLAYQFFEDYNSAYDLPLSERQTEALDAITRVVRESAWSFCLERVPTACFEQRYDNQFNAVSVDHRRCRDIVASPADLPGYGEFSHVYSKYYKR
ncbi:hypothetical protein [Marinobacter shengliensis]